MKSMLFCLLLPPLLLLLALPGTQPHGLAVVEVPAEGPVVVELLPEDPPEPEEEEEDGPEQLGATQQITVPTRDVKAIRRYLRTHYSNMLLDMAGMMRAVGCNTDECYSHCYLQGFQNGECKDEKCFCTQRPPNPQLNAL